MEVTKLKLYKDGELVNGKLLIDVRTSTERTPCIDRNENLTLHYKGDSMTLTPSDLKKRVKIMGKYLFPAKDGEPEYYLYSYEWNPIQKN